MPAFLLRAFLSARRPELCLKSSYRKAQLHRGELLRFFVVVFFVVFSSADSLLLVDFRWILGGTPLGQMFEAKRWRWTPAAAQRRFFLLWILVSILRGILETCGHLFLICVSDSFGHSF